MFRRSGSVIAWVIDGDIPDPGSPAFSAALAEHRFRTIETAASEEISIGWVSPGDPTGDSFEVEDRDLDLAVWLRFRVDQKKLPTTWLGIYRQAAEKAAGRKLNPRERRDLKDDLMQRMLPRVLPTVQFVDALYSRSNGRILLFATSQSKREQFGKLFFATFATNLIEADAHGLAIQLGLPREQLAYLEQVSPVRWAGESTAPRPLALAASSEAEA